MTTRNSKAHDKKLRVALIQFDAVPEKPDRNVRRIEELAAQAVRDGAKLVMFHEGTLTDYTPRLAGFTPAWAGASPTTGEARSSRRPIARGREEILMAEIVV
jgi:predicted amidohydrolase